MPFSLGEDVPMTFNSIYQWWERGLRGLSRGIISFYRINRLPSEQYFVHCTGITQCTLQCAVQAACVKLRAKPANLCTVQCSALSKSSDMRGRAGSWWGRRSSALQLQCVTLHTTQTQAIIVSSTCFSCHHHKSISHSDEKVLLKWCASVC